MLYYVRIEFTFQGERWHEFLGPFDKYFADLVCIDSAAGYMHGMTWVHVERAKVLNEEEYRRWHPY